MQKALPSGPTNRRSASRIWETVKATPEPYGWDPGLIWSGPDNTNYGLLKITPAESNSGGPRGHGPGQAAAHLEGLGWYQRP